MFIFLKGLKDMFFWKESDSLKTQDVFSNRLY